MGKKPSKAAPKKPVEAKAAKPKVRKEGNFKVLDAEGASLEQVKEFFCEAITDKASQNRVPARKMPVGRLFQKGNVANPGGRPKEIRQLKELAREHTVEAIETFVKIMRDKEAPPAARVMAADKLLDRGYGKATQHMVAEINVIEKMGINELRDYLAREAEELGIGSAQITPPRGRKVPASLTH